MLVINYDPDKGKAIRDSEMEFAMKDALMRANLPHLKGKRAYSLHVSSVLFVQTVLKAIKEKRVPHDTVRFEYLNSPTPHSKDGRFTKLPFKHPLRVFEKMNFEKGHTFWVDNSQ